MKTIMSFAALITSGLEQITNEQTAIQTRVRYDKLYDKKHGCYLANASAGVYMPHYAQRREDVFERFARREAYRFNK